MATAIHPVDEILPAPKLFTLGLQHVLVMYAGAIAVPLIIGRVLQGLGGGAMIVSGYLLIARAYPEELRPKAFSLLSAAWIVPSIVGPLIAGWLSDSISWRWVFWITVPLALAALAGKPDFDRSQLALIGQRAEHL